MLINVKIIKFSDASQNFMSFIILVTIKTIQ